METMNTLSKVCDAADWFDPEIHNIIHNELRESPRFHRKQWEFAMIFLALQKSGFLKPDKFGLCLGGGKERVLYAIARHIRQLVVTDLYERETTWDSARTDNPDHFIKTDKPFEVDDAKLKAQRMDMRNLDFADNTFDFCYSSCAIEHIGVYADFLQHLNEVHRVLKEGGVYVFTTEFHFGNETIEDANNFIFSADYLNKLISECKLSLAEQPDVAITHHNANLPRPSLVKDLNYVKARHLSEHLLGEVPHLQLLKGKYPFTSILFILKKESRDENKNGMVFYGRESSLSFLQAGVAEYRRWLQNSAISINPFSALPNGVSRFFVDHADFFNKPGAEPDVDHTAFHSDYFWLGTGEMAFRIGLKITEANTYQPCNLELRIHRYATLASQTVETVEEVNLTVRESGWMEREIVIPIDENY
jgi:SAM-dependent methyltransferase